MTKEQWIRLYISALKDTGYGKYLAEHFVGEHKHIEAAENAFDFYGFECDPEKCAKYDGEPPGEEWNDDPDGNDRIYVPEEKNVWIQGIPNFKKYLH